jgi:hypothetical protein
VELKDQWRKAVEEAHGIITMLPPDQIGLAALDMHGLPFRGGLVQLKDACDAGTLLFHPGYVGGAWPEITNST